jgi:hypothetical protein
MLKRSPKRKRRSKALPALGFAGVSLSMASGACASISEASANAPPPSQGNELFLGEEELSDVSLATFYVFDKENAGSPPLAIKLARGGCGGCGCHGGGCGCHGGGGGCHRGFGRCRCGGVQVACGCTGGFWPSYGYDYVPIDQYGDMDVSTYPETVAPEPPRAPACHRSEETVKVPSEGGGTRQIKIIRCP